jgi:NADP-reducing hydrogenase subunit HndC
MRRTILIKDTGPGTSKVYDQFLTLIRQEGLEQKVQVSKAADLGIYDKGTVAQILPEQTTYAQIKEEDVPLIIEETIKNNRVVDRLVYQQPDKQVRIVLRNCGVIDPESIEDYIFHDGYQAIKKILSKYSPEQVIDEMKTSGLRGRGGGGYPTWMKWNFAKKMAVDQKYIICNGDEGDPGAYMDRSVLEGDPHSVLEGMMIAGFAVGASKGFFYIRAEYPLAVRRVQKAIDQAYECGLLGEKILGTEFTFDVAIRLGAGAFVCGEETALIASIEGKRGCPSPRPPYPSIKGLWGKPTVINNVETLANVPVIFQKGGSWFAKFGSGTSKGTKVFALTGKVKNSSLIEVPMGITLREIVFDVGGGVLNDRKIKAIQTGGPSGGVIPEQFFDTPVDYDNLQKLGSIMGSGGMIVMDETDCMVDIAKFYLGFCVEESCGKCAPCRIGGIQMLNILNKISEGKGNAGDLEKLREIAFSMQKASLCGLGQTAPNPVLSTLQYFLKEFEAHVVDKLCPAGKCQGLLRYTIVAEKCKRCGICLRNCPTQAISGDRDKGYTIEQAKCIRCGRCFEVCKFNAVTKK